PLRVPLHVITGADRPQVPARLTHEVVLGQHQVPVILREFPELRRSQVPLTRYTEFAPDVGIGETGSDFGACWATFARLHAARRTVLNSPIDRSSAHSS